MNAPQAALCPGAHRARVRATCPRGSLCSVLREALKPSGQILERLGYQQLCAGKGIAGSYIEFH
jgi:hypothetical protein